MNNSATQFLNDGQQPVTTRTANFLNDEPIQDAERYTDDLRDDIRRLCSDLDLFREKESASPSPASCYVQDIAIPVGVPATGWHAIVSGNDGKLYRVDFSIDERGEPVLSDSAPVEVERDTFYEPVNKPESEVIPSPEQIELGRDAAFQKYIEGRNPPGWAVNEDKWDRAKTAASKSYDEDDDAYWPVVATLYERFGGTIKGKTAK